MVKRELNSVFASRELSFIKFNERVLDMANDKSLSIKKRLGYIKICTSNIDEFISVRLGSIVNTQEFAPSSRSIDGLSPREESSYIYTALKKHYTDIEESYKDILVELNGTINIVDITIPNSISPEDMLIINDHFTNDVMLSLCPYKISKQANVPYIANGDIALFIKCSNSYIIIPIPTFLDRHIELTHNKIIKIEDVIALNIKEHFNIEAEEILTYRVIKNLSDKKDMETNDYIKDIKNKLLKRKHGAIILYELTKASEELIKDFMKIMKAHKKQLITDLDYIKKLDVASIPIYDTDKKYIPKYIKNNNMLDKLLEEDIIMQHPYHSINYVIDFLEQSVHDKDVVSIKQTVYRLSKNSPLMHLMLEAIKNGKDVTVVFEVTARFDEVNNMYWAKRILEAGGNVVYGVQGKKVHCKVMVVTKKVNHKLINFCHIGTCNYNELNSAFFSDLSYLTSNPVTGRDITKLFTSITTNIKQDFESILSGPHVAKDTILKKMDKEIEQAKLGNEACMYAKMNALQDKDIIEKMYEASKAGVKIDLIVRGVCCIRTDQEYSKNITVKSIVGEFLEHSRLYYFKNDTHKLYIGTADMMKRNLEGRYEILTPLLNEKSYNKMYDIFQKYLGDCHCYKLHDMNYRKHRGEYNVQDYFKE